MQIFANDIENVISVDVSFTAETITVHLICELGDEQRIADSLPFLITKDAKVIIGHHQVMLKFER